MSVFVWVKGGGGIAVRECICLGVDGGGGGLRWVIVFMCGGGGIAVRDCICVCGWMGGGGVHRSTVKHIKATTRIRRPPTLADHCYQDQGMLFPVN